MKLKELVCILILQLFIAWPIHAGDSSVMSIIIPPSGAPLSPGAEAVNSPELSDAPWKRKVRLDGIRSRMLQGLEFFYHGSLIDTSSETGSRHAAGAVFPLNNYWEMSVIDRVSYFGLQTDNLNAGRESLDIRIGKKPGATFRPWLAITPYINFDKAKGEHISFAAGMNKFWKNGASLQAEIYAWRPWDEGYYTISEDGQRYGAAISFAYPLSKRLILSGRAFYEELGLGTGAKSGCQYAGNRYDLNLRGYFRLLHDETSVMGYGFRNDDLWNEYLVGSELGVYMNFDWQRYNRPGGFDAFYPVPKVFSQQVGISGQYAISPHLGISGDAFIGQDPDRELSLGELGGFNARLTVAINPQLRLWGSYLYTKTNATLESGSGAENMVSFGFNYNF